MRHRPERRLGTDRAIREAVLARRPRRALDVGCGEGWLCRSLTEAGVDAVGIDASAPLVDAARAAGGGEYHQLGYRDLVAEPRRLGRFDAVACNFALLDESLDALAAEIDKSSASDPLWLLGAGPMEMIGRAISASDPSKRPFVTVTSHSTWNDTHAALEHGGWSYAALESLGVILHHIKDQNEGLNEPYERYHWLRDSEDPRLRWLWDRGQVAGKSTFDESDAGMSYWLVTGGVSGGDDHATPEKLRDFFAGPPPAPPQAPSLQIR